MALSLNEHPAWKNLFLIAAGAIMSIALALGTYGLKSAVTHENRLVAIENSRFTNEDGAALREALNGKANKTEVPPEWLVEKVDEIKKHLSLEVNELKKRFDNVEERLREVEIELAARR